MKQCPNCRGMELYDDAETNCPYCEAALIPYVRANRRSSPADRDSQEETVRPSRPADDLPEEQPAFERHVGGRVLYRGIVSSISPTSRFMSGTVKWANAVFRGQPFQLGNPVHETIIRIEEINQARLPDKMRSLVYYGELGELNVGDDVSITAVRKHGRMVIRTLHINDIETDVSAHGQIPAVLLRLLSLMVLVLAASLVSMVISFFTSGDIWAVINLLAGAAFSLLAKALAALGPVAILLLVFWLFFRKR